MDTILRIMSIAGQYVPDEVCATLIILIGQSPELHAYAAHRMYMALSRDILQQPLVQVIILTHDTLHKHAHESKAHAHETAAAHIHIIPQIHTPLSYLARSLSGGCMDHWRVRRPAAG